MHSRNRPRALTRLLILMVVPGCAAGDRIPDAAAVLRDARAAMHGADVDSLESLATAARVTGSDTFELRVYSASDGRARVEAHHADGRVTQGGVAREGAWWRAAVADPADAAVAGTGADAADSASHARVRVQELHMLALAPLQRLRDARVVGSATFDGVPSWEVRLRDAQGRTVHLYYDRVSGLPLGAMQEGGGERMRASFVDWDTAARVRLFRKARVRHNGRALEYHYRTVRRNAVPAAWLEAPLARVETARELTPDALRALLAETSGGPYVGVGLSELLSIDVHERTGRIVVVAPVPGSPADGQVESGDELERIDGREVASLPLGEVAARLRGPAGSSVRLTLRRGGNRREVQLQRTTVAPPPVGWDTFTVEDRRIGVLRIAQFTDSTEAELQRALPPLTALAGAGVVVDVRDNPGGSLAAALAVAGAFTGAGPVALVHDGATLDSLRATGRRRFRQPVVVLVNEGTASAAELVAAALRDRGGARVVGRRTFGKGRVHAGVPLPNGNVRLESRARLITLRGEDILLDGIWPDVPLAASGSARRTSRDAEVRAAARLLAERR